MAEEKLKQEEKKEKPKFKHEEKEKPRHEERKIDLSSIVRIVSTDVPGDADIFSGFTRIKGVSWSMSNAICKSLSLDKGREVSSLTAEEIEKITQFIKKPNIPSFLLNRRVDSTTGETKHLITTELDLQRDFDIRHHKKIRNLKGLRHALGLPVRGQRTRSHFRKGKAIGVQRAKTTPQAAAAKERREAKK